MKTFDQCKDVLSKHVNISANGNCPVKHMDVYIAAMEEYAQEVAKDAWERACEAMVKSESVESISLKIQQLAADLINAGQKPYIASPIYVRYMRTVIESFEQELSICRIKPPYQPSKFDQPNQEKP